jgi:hypothetical protein
MLCITILTFGSSGTSNQVVAVFLVPSGVFTNIRNRPVSPFFHNRNLPITFTWSNWSGVRAFPVTVYSSKEAMPEIKMHGYNPASYFRF